MVALGGVLFLMSEVPLYLHTGVGTYSRGECLPGVSVQTVPLGNERHAHLVEGLGSEVWGLGLRVQH